MIKELILCRFLCLVIIIFLYPFSLAYAQTTITGTITDKTTHEKLAGVTVIIKGRTIGASTNGDGKFILNTSLKLNLNYRWQDRYTWSSSFVVGDVKAFGTMDAQVNYKLPLYNSIIKLGSSNILNKYYITSSGNPSIGGVYYISLMFDQFMR